MSINVEELNELMKNSAKDALEYFKSVHNHVLSQEESALPAVDLILAKLALEHAQAPLKKEHLFTIPAIAGAFIGEIFKSTIGGEWFEDKSDEGAPFIVLNYGGKSFPFASVCYEKIVNNPEISVAKYYELAKSGSTQ